MIIPVKWELKLYVYHNQSTIGYRIQDECYILLFSTAVIKVELFEVKAIKK